MSLEGAFYIARHFLHFALGMKALSHPWSALIC